jgi:hypothetical protein
LNVKRLTEGISPGEAKIGLGSKPQRPFFPPYPTKFYAKITLKRKKLINFDRKI